MYVCKCVLPREKYVTLTYQVPEGVGEYSNHGVVCLARNLRETKYLRESLAPGRPSVSCCASPPSHDSRVLRQYDDSLAECPAPLPLVSY